jgi:hypothetical protein
MRWLGDRTGGTIDAWRGAGGRETQAETQVQSDSSPQLTMPSLQSPLSYCGGWNANAACQVTRVRVPSWPCALSTYIL